MKKLFSLIIVCSTLTACTTAGPSLGMVDAGVYTTTPALFSLEVPQGAKVIDGKHPLGRFVTLNNLPESFGEKLIGLSANKLALTDGATAGQMKDLIVSAHDFWAKTYEGRALKVYHTEWTTLDGQPAYFTLAEAPASGLLVKPNVFYGSLSFERNGYAYVLFDKVKTGKDLVGTKGRPEAAQPQVRQAALRKAYGLVRFTDQ